jgi:hypothetical protein
MCYQMDVIVCYEMDGEKNTAGGGGGKREKGKEAGRNVTYDFMRGHV